MFVFSIDHFSRLSFTDFWGKRWSLFSILTSVTCLPRGGFVVKLFISMAMLHYAKHAGCCAFELTFKRDAAEQRA